MWGRWNSDHGVLGRIILMNGFHKCRVLLRIVKLLYPPDIVILSSECHPVTRLWWRNSVIWPLGVLNGALVLHEWHLCGFRIWWHYRVFLILFLHFQLLCLYLLPLLLHIFHVLLTVFVGYVVLVEYLSSELFGLEQLLQHNERVLFLGRRSSRCIGAVILQSNLVQLLFLEALHLLLV